MERSEIRGSAPAFPPAFAGVHAGYGWSLVIEWVRSDSRRAAMSNDLGQRFFGGVPPPAVPPAFGGFRGGEGGGWVIGCARSDPRKAAMSNDLVQRFFGGPPL